MKLGLNHVQNVSLVCARLRARENFDVIERHLEIAGEDVCFFYIDGFTKDSEMQRMMQYLLSKKEMPTASRLVAELPYLEVGLGGGIDVLVSAVLSGQTALISSAFPTESILVDLRTYPARDTAEPDGDRVMQGSHDGFVETLIMRRV